MINTEPKQEGSLSSAVSEYGSIRAAARALDIPYSTFHDRLKKEDQGIPEGHNLRGVSTLYGPSGEIKAQWVKTQEDKVEQKQIMLEAIEAMKQDIPRQEPIPPQNHFQEDLLACYVVTDYHMGQLSWAGETGDKWDLPTAEATLIKWFSSAIQSAPSAKVGVFAQVGDFLHFDGLEPVTPTSGHVVDADAKYAQLVAAAIRTIRSVINMMLEKHEHVHIIMAEGNHDLASSVWLRALFEEKYDNEPRVTVDNTHIPYYVYPWGDTTLFFHHGHKKNVKNISKTLAGMYRKEYGQAEYVYAHTGHLHHVDVKEDQLMIVEQHPTLAGKDSHSVRGGYVSQRGANVITYSKKSGEVSRITIRPEIVQ